MVERSLIEQTQWDAWKPAVLAFIRRYGDRRITVAALQRLHALDAASLAREAGTAIVAARASMGAATPAAAGATGAAAAGAHDAGPTLIGVAAAIRHGSHACIVVVKPQWRGRGIGTAMLRELAAAVAPLSCTVAADNAASLSMCANAGFTRVEQCTGPTGKPTWRLNASAASILVGDPAAEGRDGHWPNLSSVY